MSGPARDALEAAIRAACAAGRWSDALTVALEGYGGELVGYLAALTRSASDADELFGVVAEQLWRSLPRFRWDCTFRTYAYTAARNAWLKHVRGPRRRAVPLSSPEAAAIVAHVQTRTATYLRSEARDRLAELRASLDPDDQTLLILRVSRGLAWRDIARILAEDDADDAAALTRRAASLRKRFERLKVELRAQLAG